MMSRKLSSFLEYLFFLLIVISTRSIFIHLLDGAHNDRIVKILILIVSMFILLLNINSLRLEKKSLLGIVLYYIVSGALLFYNVLIIKDGILAFIFNIILLLPIFWIVCRVFYLNNRLVYLLHKYSDIVFIIASISLFFWLAGSLLDIIEPNSYLTSIWADEDGRLINGYYYLYFETQKINLLGFEGWRNTSIFVEGPIFNIVLLVAFVNLLFLDKRSKKSINIKALIILVSIFSVLSTTGIFLSIFILLYKFYFRNKLTRKRILLLLSLSPVLLYATILFLYNLALDKAQTGSASMRVDDIHAGIIAWLDSPIVGNGYTHLEAIFKYMNMSIRPNTGYSNGILSTLVQGGITLFLIYFLPFILLFIKKGRDMKFVIIMWFVIMFSTIIDNTPLFLFLCALSYSVCFAKNDIKKLGY